MSTDQTIWGIVCPKCERPLLLQGTKVFEGIDWGPGPKGAGEPWKLDFGRGEDEPIKMSVPGVTISCSHCDESLAVGFAVFAMPGQATIAANVTGDRRFTVIDGGLDDG